MYSAVVRRPLRAAFGVLAPVVVLLAFIGATATPASAHVDLVESTPANVSTVDATVGTISFRFSGPVDPVADRFRIQDASGADAPIESVEAVEPTLVVVTPSKALSSGRNRVTWALRGTDGHTMTGTIAFTITGSSSTTSLPATGGTVGAVDPATVDASADVGTGVIDEPGAGAERVATLARWLVYGAVLFSAGGLVYLTTVHRGTKAESRRLVFYVRRAALIVLTASVFEWCAQLVVRDFGQVTAIVSPSVWWDLAMTGFGIGTLLRLVGAALVLAFLSIQTDSVVLPDAVESSGSAGTVSLARVRVEASPIAFIGVGALVLSESFIGHTSSVAPRIVMVVSDVVHMLAAGAWAAGAFLLASTLWRRHRRGEPTDARLLAARFSVLAAGSVVAVGVTGIVLGWLILTGPGASWTSDFGWLLLVKIVLVAVVASIGGYNHRVLVPALADGDEARSHLFRWIVTAESLLFAAVLLVTAVLVNSDPTG